MSRYAWSLHRADGRFGLIWRKMHRNKGQLIEQGWLILTAGGAGPQPGMCLQWQWLRESGTLNRQHRDNEQSNMRRPNGWLP
eukprot:6191651-Pleurochrysis_carterae.AAC.3